jgi:hypothetical protein
MTWDGGMDRRTLLRAGLAGGVLAAAGVPLGPVASARPPDEDLFTVTPGRRNGALPPKDRYRYRLFTSFGLVAEVARIEEVWAHHQYTRLSAVEIVYSGPGARALSASEKAVVQVARDAGATPSDDAALFDQVLLTCTHTPPSILPARLRGLGVPGVEAALAMAPEAPQAEPLRRWLDTGAA